MITLISLLSFVSPVDASELSIGSLTTINDPFLNSFGVRGGGAIDIVPGARLCATAALLPDRDDANWNRLTKQLIEENHVSPDISKRKLEAELSLAIEPFRGRVGAIGTALALYAGLGVVRTADDLQALDADESNDLASATQHQTIPTSVWGVVGDVYLNPLWGLRLRWHHLGYVETAKSIYLEMKSVEEVGFEVVFVLDAKNRAVMEGAK
jgi:hypothetical protein